MNHKLVFPTAFFALLLAMSAHLYAQRGQRGGQRGQPSVSPKVGAAIDLTGYWVSVVTEDWQFRMVTPPRGDYSSVPLTREGRAMADAWDPVKDEAAGNSCKAYGAAGIMRVPGRLHITWENDNTLRIDTDAGTQTRLLHFGGAPGGEAKRQGCSSARWEYATGQSETTSAEDQQGHLRVVTNQMLPGYLRKNGVPYSGNAVMNETFERIRLPNGDDWLVVTTIVEDSLYLSSPFITSTNFKRLPNALGWDPTSCSAK